MSKRKEFVWQEENTIWKRIPMVMIVEALQKQKWFTGYANYYPNSTNESIKRDFEKEIKNKDRWGLVGPNKLKIYQKHKNSEIEVHIEWNKEESRCFLWLSSPFTRIYQPNGGYNNPKKVSSQFLEGIIKRIEKAFAIGISVVEEIILEEEAKKRKIQKANEYKENLSDELGVVLTSPGTYQLHEYQYGKGKPFGLCFEREDDSIDEFQVTDIKGNFGKEEIKQLIKIIGGNPKAIAARLTNTKRRR